MLNEGGKENVRLREKIELTLTEIVVVFCENDYGEQLLKTLSLYSESKNNVTRALADIYVQMAKEKLGVDETINLDGITSTCFIDNTKLES